MVPDIARLERRARALRSPEVYDFYAGGSGQEATLRANVKAWRRLWLAPRVLRDVSSVDTSLTLWGTELRTPVAVAPTAFHRLAHPEGEVATAAGAAQAGALFVLSTRSSCRIEDVGAAVARAGGTWWFQAYVMRDRALTAALVRGLSRRRAPNPARDTPVTRDAP
jgi:4-hydroxymandelate oxidase